MVLGECTSCQAKVNATILHSYEWHSEDEPSVRYNFGKCPRCAGPFIIGQTDWGRGYEDEWQIHPLQDRGPSQSLPAPILSAYVEALACYKARAFTAAAIMCRKTVEGLCVAHGVHTSNLAASLKSLRDKGIIEARLFEWADALRLSGNEAAHDVSVTISPEDAKDIVEFTNALLEYVFTFRDRFTAFQKRRQLRQAAT
jgi:hypothetical protein